MDETLLELEREGMVACAAMRRWQLWLWRRVACAAMRRWQLLALASG
jgi:hypothetical protein